MQPYRAALDHKAGLVARVVPATSGCTCGPACAVAVRLLGRRRAARLDAGLDEIHVSAGARVNTCDWRTASRLTSWGSPR